MPTQHIASTYKTCDCGGCFADIVGDSDGVDLCDDCEAADCDPFANTTECSADACEECEGAPIAAERIACARDNCAGEGHLLGVLGTKAHYRCRACGTDFSTEE